MSDWVYLWESFSDIPDEKWEKIFGKKEQEPAPVEDEKKDEFDEKFEQIDWSENE